MIRFRTFGKWILCGEHSVLKGGKALAFPSESYYLDFEYEALKQDLSLEIFHYNRSAKDKQTEKPHHNPEENSLMTSEISPKKNGGESHHDPEFPFLKERPLIEKNQNKSKKNLERAFWNAFEKALKSLNLVSSQIGGKLKFSSNIPVGAGLGASAALCVSLGRWMTHLGYLSRQGQYEFAKNLENLFHGESSGVDVAVVLENKIIEFQKPSQIQIFKPVWEPLFYLSYCGERGLTSRCVQKVQEFSLKNPSLAERINQDMGRSVRLAEEALSQKGELSKLVQAVNLAGSCFENWSLIGKQLGKHIHFLKEKGALAVKPTGSGLGGFALSLWDQPPPKELSKILIKA